MKVLVTGAGALLGQGIIRALRSSTLRPHIVAVDPDPRAAGLYWADSGHLVPMADSSDYDRAVRRLLEVERPDALLVGTDVELAFFAEEREALECDFGVSVIVSGPDVVEIADDKWKTFRFLEENGFPCPRSSVSLDDEEYLRHARYPLLVKPRRGARSVGVRIVHSREELAAAFGALEDPIIQECVGSPAEEYTAGALVFDGECRASIVMRRDLRDGNTYRAFVRPYPELNAGIRTLAERLHPHGPVNFQFRLCEGRVTVFEINARFSGTTPLRGRAGFNEVEMCLRHLLLGEKIRQPSITPLVLLRHWEETVLEWDRFEDMSRRAVPDFVDA